MEKLKTISLAMFPLMFLLYSVYSADPAEGPQVAQGQIRSSTTDLFLSVESLRRELKETKDSLESVRRDQLNYRLEKNLLKETYSSNFQTINIVITIVLAMITVVGSVIGFLSVRSVAHVRDDFRQELEKLVKLRNQFEEKFAEIGREQKEARAKFEELATVNEQQDKRLKVLELQEKVSGLAREGNYSRALDYANVGLELVPNEPILMRQKVNCLMGLYRFPEAADFSEQLLKIDPRNPVIFNLLEAYVLMGQFPEFDRLYEVNKQNVAGAKGVYMGWYLECLRRCISQDLAGLRAHIIDGLKNVSPDKGPRIQNWRYTEARFVLGQMPDSSAKTLMLAVLGFLEGNLAPSELQAISDAAV